MFCTLSCLVTSLATHCNSLAALRSRCLPVRVHLFSHFFAYDELYNPTLTRRRERKRDGGLEIMGL